MPRCSPRHRWPPSGSDSWLGRPSHPSPVGPPITPTLLRLTTPVAPEHSHSHCVGERPRSPKVYAVLHLPSTVSLTRTFSTSMSTPCTNALPPRRTPVVTG